MSGAYLYCIVPRGYRPGDVQGIGGTPVILHDDAQFGLWLSTLDSAPTASLETVQRHNAVISAAMTDEVTPVPMRFGQWLASEDAALERVNERAPAYVAALATFQGAVEMGVRIVESRPVPAPRNEAVTGRAYMEMLARREADRTLRRTYGEQIAIKVRRPLTGYILQERTEPLEQAGVMSIAHLIRRADMNAYSAAVRQVETEIEGVRLVQSGPWPPYSFVP